MPAIPKCLACLVTFDAAEHTPMVLGVCGHSICLACIERLKNLSQAEQTCPTCREPTDPMSSKPNFALRDSIAAATAAAVQAPPPPVPSGVDACPTHGDRIRFLCATHNLLCCATCFLEDHEDCDRHPLEAARQSLERRIITALNDMRESGEKLQNGQVALAERANLLSSKREAVKSQVHAFFHEVSIDDDTTACCCCSVAMVYHVLMHCRRRRRRLRGAGCLGPVEGPCVPPCRLFIP